MELPAEVARNPFAVLSFLVAPAILTNASTLLALSTSNRLARASDRARLASTALLSMSTTDSLLADLQQKDFHYASIRAEMLVKALRYCYLASASFATGTLVALLGAFAGYFGAIKLVTVTEVLTVGVVMAGVVAISSSAIELMRETRIALQMVATHHAAITQWRATHQIKSIPPAV